MIDLLVRSVRSNGSTSPSVSTGENASPSTNGGASQGASQRSYLPSINEVWAVCKRAEEILLDEPTVASVSLPVTIIGDIHGQFEDLINLLTICESGAKGGADPAHRLEHSDQGGQGGGETPRRRPGGVGGRSDEDDGGRGGGGEGEDEWSAGSTRPSNSPSPSWPSLSPSTPSLTPSPTQADCWRGDGGVIRRLSGSLVFLGDYVDRGLKSVETILFLLCLKTKFPRQVHLLRGNHESRQITQVYGFYDECLAKFGGNPAVWRFCTDVFDLLPLAAVVGGRVFCVHGGLSPQINLIDEINLLKRNREVPNLGAFGDLLWSDPDEAVDTWELNPRGAGYLFGAKVADAFTHLNDLSLVVRAHQLAMKGYQFHFQQQNANFLTVWSAPNYCYRCGNLASAVKLHQEGYLDFYLTNAFDHIPTPPHASPSQHQQSVSPTSSGNFTGRMGGLAPTGPIPASGQMGQSPFDPELDANARRNGAPLEMCTFAQNTIPGPQPTPAYTSTKTTTSNTTTTRAYDVSPDLTPMPSQAPDRIPCPSSSSLGREREMERERDRESERESERERERGRVTELPSITYDLSRPTDNRGILPSHNTHNGNATSSSGSPSHENTGRNGIVYKYFV